MSEPHEDSQADDDRGDITRWQWTSWLKVSDVQWRKLPERFWRVPLETRNERLAHCEQCDAYNKTLRVCSKCGCAMRIKTWLGGFGCPLDKWQALEKPTTEEND